MYHDIVATETPTAADRNAVLALLVAYNDSQAARTATSRWRCFCAMRGARPSAACWAARLYVELLGVPEPLRRRGIGTQLMRRAETVAIERGCVGVWVDTYGFQARGFYEKLGYEIFGTIDDHPRGSHRFFFRKRL